MDNTHFDGCKFDLKDAELEHIEYLLTGGADIKEISLKYSHIAKEEITRIIKRVERLCWLSEDEAATRTINGKDYIVKSTFLDSGEDIKTAILKLAERKTMREMGFDIPLEFERDNPL